MNATIMSTMDSLSCKDKVDSVYFLDTGEPVPNSNKPGRLIPNQSIAVNTSCEPLAQLVQKQQLRLEEHERRHQQLEEQFKRSKEQLAKALLPAVRNVASQVLKKASGQDFYKSKSTRFDKLGPENASIKAAADKFGVEPSQFIEAADALLTRRNRVVHPRDLGELYMKVEEVTGHITPTMQALPDAEWACRIVLKFEDIRKAFPEQFPELEEESSEEEE